MVQVRVAGVALDESGQHVILLKPLAPSSSVLPIWIGGLEATSIMVAIEGAAVPRPLAHDLMRSLLEGVSAGVRRVEITRLDGGTFYAEITLDTTLGPRAIDARPSDAVALASRVGAPIFVADAVMIEAAVPDMMSGDDDRPDGGASEDGPPITGEEEEQRVDEFKRFLDGIDPDDFRG